MPEADEENGSYCCGYHRHERQIMNASAVNRRLPLRLGCDLSSLLMAEKKAMWKSWAQCKPIITLLTALRSISRGGPLKNETNLPLRSR